MTRIGLELNGSVVRGVLGPAGDYPPPLPLEPPGHDLPMVFLLERSTPELGRAATNVVREKGHLICRDFLHHVGETGPKGCMLVTVHDNRTVDTEFRCLDVLRWEICAVDAHSTS